MNSSHGKEKSKINYVGNIDQGKRWVKSSKKRGLITNSLPDKIDRSISKSFKNKYHTKEGNY